MGIPGLMSYINNRSTLFMQYYELHDTYLVIDGNSIGCQIYNLYAKCNCAFGGDYDLYAQSVSDFFDNLLKCNVTPLVLIDGGYENKKLKTVISRTKDRIRNATSYCPLSQARSTFFPLFLKDVFKDVMEEKNIRYAQCLFEADNAIAAVAKVLNCPVLSYDSDFYIYGILYIPFNTLNNYIVKSSTRKGYMIRCQIYRVENLLNSFRGLEKPLLPLAAVLLGNDYVKRSIFKNFYRQLKLKGANRKKRNHLQCRIEAVLTWLSRYTLEKAIIGILSRLPKFRRQYILDVIETNINGYTNATAEILIPLGFSKEYTAYVDVHSVNRTYKYNDDINNLSYIEETYDAEDSETNEDEEEEEEDDRAEIANIIEECDKCNPNDKLINSLPKWFLTDFTKGKFPTYFMDLIVRGLYICPVQIEDCVHSPSIIRSLKIIGVIFKLLTSERHDETYFMKYMTRGQNRKITFYQLNSTENVSVIKLPSLSRLREIPLDIRREIFNDTLGMTGRQYILELPQKWMLYISTAVYWVEHEEQQTFKSPLYIYCILLCMLFNVIDEKIGKYRTMNNFQNKYSRRVQNIQQKRKMDNYKPCYSMNVTIAAACTEIDSDDCLLAAQTFISHFGMDQKLYSQPKKFNRSIVHAFSEFQNCLRHSMNLNALLEYPYPPTKVATLFNGTLLYNLYNNFKTRNNVETYIDTILKDSQSLLRLFHVLLLKVKPLFTTLCQSEVHVHKKHKSKCNRKKLKPLTIDVKEEPATNESLCEPAFYDANNSFTLLSSSHQTNTF